MADCISGLTLARGNRTSCDEVKKICAYATCQDTKGGHCYGLDSNVGQPAGYQNTSYASNCEDRNCPLAWEHGYPLVWDGAPACCADPNMVIVCDPDCTCNDLATLTATLPPLTTTTPFPTSTALSSSFAQVTSSSVTSIMLTPGSLLPTPGTSPVAAPVSGLTTGAKAGIGVGAAVGGAVIFGLIFWLAWVLRERRKETAKLSPGVDTGEPEWKHDRMREKGGPIDLE